MRARKLVVVGLVVAAVGFLTYSCVSRTDDTEDVASPAASTTVAVPTTTVAPTDVVTIEPSAVSSAAEEAARQGLTVAFTWYPATDATQNDAYGRARTWLTSTLAARMIVDASTERGPGVQWGQWAQQGAKVIADVSIECSGCPEDTDTVVHRVATIKQTAVAGNTTDTVKPDTTVWVTIVREGDRWLIDDIRY
ncbi:hypothetical protein [Rhodococcus zopfii]|uniref:hypothetical protein n=1 Tax=Rhodococcus zopfii TaxID=43772 RepID=UPI000A5EA304|nr:hypothetical protein [Rhodococcus zopfii]